MRNELWLKLGLQVSPRTVGKYLAKRPTGRPRGDQAWSTFLKNHAQAMVACDFFVAVTSTFRLLYVFAVMEHREPTTDSLQCDGSSDCALDAPAAA